MGAITDRCRSLCTHSRCKQALKVVPVGSAGDLIGLEQALLASAAEQESGSGRPPAAKSAVRSLQKETLTGERLQELGHDVQCSVCRSAPRHLPLLCSQSLS